MNSNNYRNWNVLSWNVRGINASWKWNAVKDKIMQSSCDIVCLQETNKDVFYSQFLKHICLNSLDAFEFLPSNGASRGILVAWNGSLFSSNKIFSNDYCLSMEFTSTHNDAYWVLTCVYGPCTAEAKVLFLNWLKEIQMPDNVDWLILGDFNLIRQEDRN